MLARLKVSRSKVSRAIGTAICAVGASLLVAGCNDDGGTGTRSVSPPVNNADINPWLLAIGDWSLAGAGKSLRVSATGVETFEYNQSGCVATGGFDLVEGLNLYDVIENTGAGLNLKLNSANFTQTYPQTYQSMDLPESCAQPLGDDATAKQVFDYVWQALNDYYAHFGAKDIDWQSIYQQHSALIDGNTTPQQLEQILSELVKVLSDANVVLSTDDASFSGHKIVPIMNAAIASANNALSYGGGVTPAQAYMQLKGIYLTIQKSFVVADTWKQWPAAEDLAQGQVPSLAWGVTDNNVGLLVLNELANVEPATITQALSDLAQTDGVLLDAREAGYIPTAVNSQITDVIASHFIATSGDTHQTQVSNHSVDTADSQTHQVTGSDAAYQNPVYVITSQGTSRGVERMVLALQSQNHVKVVGEHTSGALSNPVDFALPNGWRLSLPNAVAKNMAGDVLSGVGITPDIEVPAYTQTSTRDGKFESYQRAMKDMDKFEFPVIAVADYEAQMNQLMAQGLIPGAAVAVVKGGEIVYSQGFGRADENGRVVSADTPFYVASISKTILGTTIAQAESAGLLSVDDAIEDSLSFDVGYPVYADFKPNLKHLMTHTAGLSDDGVIDLCTYYFEDDHTSLANWFYGQPVCQEPINPSLSYHLSQYFSPQGSLYKPTHFSSNYGAQPGKVNRYSNYGAALAAQSLEAATGRTLPDLTNEFVINPLGMTNTLWSIDGVPVDAARRYLVTANGVPVPLREYRTIAYPAGDGVSTANDLAKYMAAAMNGGVYQGEQKLNVDAVNRMLTSQSDVPTTERGVGYFWRLDGDYFSHNGGNFGVLSDAWADTHHDVAVVLLTNGDVLHSPAITSMIGMFAASKAFAYGLDD